MTRYRFRQGLGAFFLADEAAARSLLPPALHPLEARPGHAVFALTALDFADSEVGAYGELVLSILVPPFARRGHTMPLTGVFPFAVATSTDAAAAHSAERWRLPVLPRRLDLHFDTRAGRHHLHVTDHGETVLRLSVDQGPRTSASTLYQCFSADGADVYRVSVEFEGEQFEHQEETGELFLAEHPLARRVRALLADDLPFLEQSMSAGEERFGVLEPHTLHERVTPRELQEAR